MIIKIIIPWYEMLRDFCICMDVKWLCIPPITYPIISFRYLFLSYIKSAVFAAYIVRRIQSGFVFFRHEGKIFY